MRTSGPAAFRGDRPSRRGCAAGFTLLELTVVLALCGVALGLSFPVGRGLLDRWSTAAARDEALSALHRIRVEARLRGGASLVVHGGEGVLSGLAGDSLLWVRAGARDHGVAIREPDGSLLVDTLAFDALGLGIVTSRTLVFEKGGSEVRLVVSSRGRGSRR